MSNQDETRQLLRDLWESRIGRRQFMQKATAAGLSLTAAVKAMPASAQDATPGGSATPGTPGATTGTGQAVKSMTRDEYYATLREKFTFEEPGTTGGDVLHGNTTDIANLNPILVTDTYSGWYSGLLFNQVTTGNPWDGTQVPDLADYWVQEADGITYTFYLNKDAKWHDGQPVTADDVVFSFDATLAENSQSPRKSSVELVLDSYKKVDDHTVQLVSKGPISIFLENSTALVGIVPKHIWQDVPMDESWGTDPGNTGADPSRVVGSGPFKFKEWVVNDHITVVKNADYWDPNAIPVIDSFTSQVIPEASAAVQALQTAQVDVLNDVPFAQADVIKQANPQLTIEDYPTTSFNYYTCRVDDMEKSPFFTEIPVRQAMMYALDRDLIASTVYKGYAERADGTQPKLSIAYFPDRIKTIYKLDVDKANKLLDDAGWVKGSDGVRAKNGVRFSFECLYSEGVATYEQQLPYMQQAWAEVGIEMKPTAIPFPTLSDRAKTADLQMAVWGFSWGVSGEQGDMFRSDAWRPHGFNTMHYSNKKYDELDAQQFRELDVEKRIDILIEQSNIVNDEQAAGILVFRSSIAGKQNTVHNFLPNGYSFSWSIPFMWLEK